MHWLTLPEVPKTSPPAFHDAASAKAWLAGQPKAQPLLMLEAIGQQIEAIEASTMPPNVAIDLLNLLRTAAAPALESLTPRYLRKALPMPAEDRRSFELAQRLWLRLGIAYLRQAPHFAPAGKVLPLNRAASAFRQAQYCHFEAAQACPPNLDQLLFAVLGEADHHKLLGAATADPDFPHFGAANTGGHIAWAFMLRLVAPYRLSATQLGVANRAISRWRELASFHATPADDPRAHSVDLAPLFGRPLPDGVPRWLDVRKISRKIEQRISALSAGETPEALKLGHELSGPACIRLLRLLESSLEAHVDEPTTEIGDIELAFGCAHAYAVLSGELLNAAGGLDAAGASLAHQRLAMFGFDRHSTMPTAVKKLNVPSEKWTLVDGKAIRAADQAGNRRLTPCLVATKRHGQPVLGVLNALKTNASGALEALLDWYPEHFVAGRLAHSGDRGRQPAIAALVSDAGGHYALIVPATAGIRLNEPVRLEGLPVNSLLPAEVTERGVDFVRYACRLA